jgi:hypothetical protein
MIMRTALNIPAALRAGITSLLAVRKHAIIYMMCFFALDFCTALLYSQDLWNKKSFHTSDGILFTLSLLIHGWLWIGISKISLAALRQEPVHTFDLFTSPAIFLRALLVGAVMLIPLGLGFLLLLVPGIYLSMMWSQSFWLLIDDRARHIDSLKMSTTMTEGNLWNVTKVFFLMALLALPWGVIDRVSIHNPELFDSILGALSLTVAGCLQIVVGVIDVFVAAAMYQQLMNSKLALSSAPAPASSLELNPS